MSTAPIVVLVLGTMLNMSRGATTYINATTLSHIKENVYISGPLGINEIDFIHKKPKAAPSTTPSHGAIEVSLSDP